MLSDTFTRECAHLRDYALVQSLYKFINDVVIFETEIVDRTARSIAKDHFTIRFPFACRYDAMTVVVDEDYHALVAMDFMQQTIALTGIEPIRCRTRLNSAGPFPLHWLWPRASAQRSGADLCRHRGEHRDQ